MLQKYNFDFQFSPGKSMVVSDALSRASLTDSDNEILDDDMKCYVHVILNNLPISDEKLRKFQCETQDDKSLQILRHYVQNGLPDYFDVDSAVKPD